MLHVIIALAPGGAETALYRLVNSSSDINHEIVCLAGRDWYSVRLEDAGITVHHLNMCTLTSSVIGAIQLNTLIRRSGADVVQCWMYRSNVLAGVFARFAGIPVIWNVRCSSPELLGLSSRLWARAAGVLARYLPSAVVNCSKHSAEVHTELGYRIARVVVIPNGYDPGEFFPDKPARVSMRQSLGFDERTFVIGSIARWDIYKDMPTLFSALAEVRRRGVPSKCLLIGNNLDRRNLSLMQCIRQFGGEDYIFPMGRRSDVPEIARAMDLHVLASQSEGFPNVIAETMLSGTPNVATGVGDAALIVGHTGWIVPPRNPERLADGIQLAYEEWRSSREQWEQRRGAARQRISENFSLRRMAQAYVELWRNVAKKAA